MTATATQTKIESPATQNLHSLGSPRAELLLKAARNLGPVLEARQDACNNDHRVPERTIADFHDAGFFKILQSSDYGVYELDPQVFYSVLLDIA